MRIVLDLQGAQGTNRVRGIGRYSLAFARAIAERHRSHDVVNLLSGLYPASIEGVRESLADVVATGAIRAWDGPRSVRAKDPANAWRRAVATRLREAALGALRPDAVVLSDPFGGYRDDTVVAIPAGRPYRAFVIVYDLIPLRAPADYLDRDPAFREYYLARLDEIRRADGWLAISGHTARDLVDRLGVPAERVATIGAAPEARLGLESRQPVERAAVLARHGIRARFVLASGGSDPRKNIGRLVEAFAGLPFELRRDRQLVVTGATPPDQAATLEGLAARAGLGSDALRLVGHVSDADLVALYSACELFVFPSLSEGFGLPAIEAMACGAPVIGADATSIPEVIGWSEALFDPLRVEDIRRVMARGLTDDAFRAELRTRGAERVASHSWAAVADRALDAIEAWGNPDGDAVAEQGVLDPAMIISRLIGDIRGLEGDPSEADLIATASALDANHPETRPGGPSGTR